MPQFHNNKSHKKKHAMTLITEVQRQTLSTLSHRTTCDSAALMPIGPTLKKVTKTTAVVDLLLWMFPANILRVFVGSTHWRCRWLCSFKLSCIWTFGKSKISLYPFFSKIKKNEILNLTFPVCGTFERLIRFHTEALFLDKWTKPF